jgi:glyoxylase-like metal-dependent hydrolase (beta-lactamase superfamily II)
MEIAKGIYSMSQEQGGHVHAYLLDDGTGLTLIDTLYDDDANVVLAEIARIGRTPAQLKHIILTHAHKSHIGGVAALKKASGATVCSHTWEVDIIAGRRTATRVSLIPQKPLRVYTLQLGLALGLGRHVPCQVDRTLKAGDHVGPLQVIETPGHTPGCLSFWWADRRALFVGDVIATWPEFAPGWPGLTLDNAQNLRSAHQFTDFSNADMLGVGHGEAIVRDAAREIRTLLK